MSISLEKAIRGFHLSNEASNRSPTTIQWHHSNLTNFRKWLEANAYETLLSKITPDILREPLASMQVDAPRYRGHPFKKNVARPLAPRTIHGRYRSLSAFLNWAVREELIAKSPLSNIPRPKVPKYIPNPFTEAEVKRLIKACDDQSEDTRLREIAIVLFFLDTGVGKKELLSLTMDKLQIDRGQALVMGKGSKQRYVHFASRTRRALWRYTSLGRPEPVAHVNNVFLSHDGRTMKESRLAYVLRRLGQRADVVGMHPHRFRRAAAIQFLRNGGNLFALQKMLGHETLEMVRRYLELADSDLEEAHKSASPVDNWNL